MTDSIPARPSPNSAPGSGLACALPALLPRNESARLLLFAFRRLGAHGLQDARVTQAYLAAFGAQFRRPLMLTRAFVADCATTATAQISIAPCCCPRATAAEACMLRAVADVETRSDISQLLLADLLGTRRPDGVVASAAALAAAFADLGKPVLS